MKRPISILCLAALTPIACGIEDHTRSPDQQIHPPESGVTWRRESPLRIEHDANLADHIRTRYACMSDQEREALTDHFAISTSDLQSIVATDPLALPTITLLVSLAAGAVGLVSAVAGDEKGRRDRERMNEDMRQEMEGGFKFLTRSGDESAMDPAWDFE